VPAPAAAGTGSDLPAGTGGSGPAPGGVPGSSTTDPATDLTTAPVPDQDPAPATGVDDAGPVQGPAPAAPLAPTAAPAAAAPVRQAPVAAQLAPQLAVLRTAPDGSQTMTLVITPESLGPVSIQVTVTDGTLELTLQGAHAHGRHALTEALPDLRRDLESAGLTFSRLEVDARTGADTGAGDRTAQQQLADMLGNSGRQDRATPPDSRSRPWAPPGTHLGEGGPVLTSSSSASPGVDVRV
jgi:flagellar hook-length control protein FliK